MKLKAFNTFEGNKKLRNKTIKLKYKYSIYGISFAALSILGFVFFYFYPFIISVMKSVVSETNHYMQVLKSQTFQLAMWNTFKFMIIGVPILYVISILVALAMNRLYAYNMKGRGIILTFHMLPMLIPSSVIAFFIGLLFDNNGLVNGILNQLNFNSFNWLHSSSVFFILIFVYIWKNYGYCMIILMGGIQSIPYESIEAAKLEGANGFAVFTKIILPQIKSYSIFTVMIGIIGIFKVFRESYMMFGSYPDQSIYMMQNFMNNCFYSLNYNRLAAASTIMIIILTIIVLVFLSRDNEWRRRL